MSMCHIIRVVPLPHIFDFERQASDRTDRGNNLRIDTHVGEMLDGARRPGNINRTYGTRPKVWNASCGLRLYMEEKHVIATATCCKAATMPMILLNTCLPRNTTEALAFLKVIYANSLSACPRICSITSGETSHTNIPGRPDGPLGRKRRLPLRLSQYPMQRLPTRCPSLLMWMMHRPNTRSFKHDAPRNSSTPTFRTACTSPGSMLKGGHATNRKGNFLSIIVRALIFAQTNRRRWPMARGLIRKHGPLAHPTDELRDMQCSAEERILWMAFSASC